jgi:hypothetical protein
LVIVDELKFDIDTTFVVFRAFSAHQYALAVDEVSQRHLLVAGEFVPRRCVGEDVHREMAVEEVSDELTADVLIHEIEV